MSRKKDARNRAHRRWEFVRRNKGYIEDYNKKLSDVSDIVNFEALNDKVCQNFLKKYNVYPINPNYGYKEICEKYQQLRELKFRKTKSKSEKQKNKIKDVFRRIDYLHKVLYKLLEINLSNEDVDIYSSHTLVIHSYIADNSNIEAFRFGNKVGLADSTVADFDTNPILEKYDGDLSRVCFEVDLSYPTDDLVEDFKKEVALWKTVARKYQPRKQKRQVLYNENVENMLKIYDYRESGMIFRSIAKKILDDDQNYAIQKVRNLYDKANRYIEGGYKQIR